MNKEHCFLLGPIAKAHGNHGEVIIHIDDNVEINEKTESLFVETDGIKVPFFIAHFKYTNAGLQIQFDTLHTPEQARKYIDCPVFIEEKFLPNATPLLFKSPQITGYKVIDSKLGILGPVNKSIQNPRNPLLIVDYKNHEIFIPVNDTFITAINKKKKTIHTTLPEGLIDIN